MPRMGNGLTRWIGRTILTSMRWRVEGKLPNEPKVIVIGGPHTSNWDLILAMSTMLALGLRFSWMMKKEAFFWPLGALWRALGGIPIDRKAAGSMTQQMADWFNSVETGWLGMTPEGTRSSVRDYKRGYLRISNAAQVPIFIVGIDAPKKRVVLDRIWPTTGNVEADNNAIKTYIDSNYKGIRTLDSQA